ncbi:S8 family peptidase [Hymenobacter tibetensis]|uniref:S8 family peptidase n=1 Tax=Hymenobacter tibetensis TaxID=497967 RepID=A0ABY4D3R1_9BACT|nr:S8 family peptidase [Hymenobacter tibetensis]UOG76569.1 S8 family peptidase [Hymenobacter tibetensis]
MPAPQSSSQRYIVTYADQNISSGSAAEVLNITADRVQDGVSLLESDQPLTASEVLHFDGLGSSSLVLTTAEVENLKHDQRVVAVEPDLEVHILGGDAAAMNGHALNGNGSPDLYDTEESLFDQPQQSLFTQGPGFQAGYQQAITDLHARMLEQMNSMFQSAATNSGSPVLTPPRLPLTPVKPVLPPIVWPPLIQQPIPWNIKMVKAPQAWPRTKGADVRVAVLDTGIANHSDLTISGGASFVPGVTSYNDGHGHGTHCAGVIGARNNALGVVGVAPLCKIYAVKVLNDAGSGQLSWILAGMAWARTNGMQVVSMSLGSNSGPVAAYTVAVQQLLAAGCVVVAAAGNTGGPVGAPANSPGVIAVAAVDQNKVVAPFSSRGGNGNQVTISAPGVSVNSTYLNNGFKPMSGTSMACPHVAGGAALLKARYPAWTPTAIMNRLKSTAADLGVPGNDIVYGVGLLDCDAATM